MSKKLEFKDKNQRKKCWLYASISSLIFTIIFVIIGILGNQKCDFLSIFIIFLIFLWTIFDIYKFYFVAELKNDTKFKCLAYSLLFLVVLGVIMVILGIKSYPKFFGVSTSFIIIIGIPIVFFNKTSHYFCNFLLLDNQRKKETIKFWIFSGLYALIIGLSFFTLFNIIDILYFSPLVIGILSIVLFLMTVKEFNSNRKQNIDYRGVLVIILGLLLVLYWCLFR